MPQKRHEFLDLSKEKKSSMLLEGFGQSKKDLALFDARPKVGGPGVAPSYKWLSS
jgi:hypothetical protein